MATAALSRNDGSRPVCEEMFLSSLRGERDGRLWRSVPNRRWYSDQRGETPGSQEVVLIHRKVETATTRPPRRLPKEVRNRP